MDKRSFNITIIIFFTVIFFKFFTGIFKDNEHNEYYFFIKHKPTWQYYFKIIGEKWEFYETLPFKEKKEVDKYDFYVKNRIYSLYIYGK
ncbi:hypothetical protein J2Q11_13755 [Tenacibaculum finnmarkense genomovar finnmarkense]|uniref:Uncharacterized protein n=1 Tax=Tenacibaculum finnmarkense genomovar finnmarkense TaxID=1458503 RepID=A0AAP1RI48_9FLAO|nr:hypothetical protein [Tenacibaculum finnmarkense]MBE7653986.1 hypothetical protein [Tenacibaculum finnmarkense genomovar finnmarkense]MBE7696282.1 hypothetical protein [Tenacibaculum finnmarkense genomovar finnmarkense]MCD8418792.1 hypothetical protein [Tenacibaculum finnmarkense genomovar finnmarkense]MCD8428529.1 hypothetical protein [Tenacibaculum finnmarkense genomovar finnmarkense]MCD8440922.1 hypothetical protein [Tenacibaculum finnmarkense genomovar ulcerans]